MSRISQLFNLGVSQYELDFVDIDLDKDYPLFIDPFLISNSTNQWAIQTDKVIKIFFEEFKTSILNEDYDKSRELFRYMSEPKETCLGVSSRGTTNGRGVGRINTQKIIDRIIESNAITDKLVNNIEDLAVFVEDIDRDKLSDMVTNIVRKNLIDYTKMQCNLWDIRTKKAETLPYWDIEDRQWVYSDDELLIINGREVLLVPKSIVGLINEYSASKYNWHFIVEQERDFHVQRRSSLVKYKPLKNGKTKIYLPKKDVQEDIRHQIDRGDYSNTKDFIRKYTQKYPKLFEQFIDKCKRTVKMSSNDEIADYIEEDIDIGMIIDNLISKLNSIPAGKEHASEFHHFVKALLEIIWYPNLINPVIEKEIHDGRKRIDIVMDNNTKEGFFNKLHSIAKIYCPYIYMECKNYGKDVANPEIDQLSGRFGTNRGQFGILICREIKDVALFEKRCKDTYRDNRGLIIHLTDSDIIEMLNAIKENNNSEIDSLLEKKKKTIILG